MNSRGNNLTVNPISDHYPEHLRCIQKYSNLLLVAKKSSLGHLTNDNITREIFNCC